MNKAEFLKPYEEGSVAEAGYEFSNAKTPEYAERWWMILIARFYNHYGQLFRNTNYYKEVEQEKYYE